MGPIEIEIDANDLRRLAGGDTTAPRITGATSRPSATSIHPAQIPRAKQIEQVAPSTDSTLPKGILQYTYVGCRAQNSPPSYMYLYSHEAP